MPKTRWHTADYDEMSWHNNHVHGLAIRAGEHGTGELALDLDYILEWLPSGNLISFRIAPATLVFHEVSNLNLALDYLQPLAAITPFSLGNISRQPHVFPNGYSTFRWEVAINWPEGFITFLAAGFEQTLRGEPCLTSNQWLTPEERAPRP